MPEANRKCSLFMDILYHVYLTKCIFGGLLGVLLLGVLGVVSERVTLVDCLHKKHVKFVISHKQIAVFPKLSAARRCHV